MKVDDGLALSPVLKCLLPIYTDERHHWLHIFQGQGRRQETATGAGHSEQRQGREAASGDGVGVGRGW